MMTANIQQERVFRLSGHQNASVLMDSITKLKQELSLCQSEKQKLTDQLNCLISLVKRAWNGDKGASLHLSNIIGQTIDPDAVDIGRPMNTPVQPLCQSQAVKNWERFTIRVLEREYKMIQQEIEDRQRFHLHSRELYIEEILKSHHEDMANFSNQRYKSSVCNFDKKFITNYNKTKSKPRAQSAIHRPSSKTNLTRRRQLSAGHRDPAPDNELTFADLIVHRSESRSHGTADKTKDFKALYKMNADTNDRSDYRAYDDSSRYAQPRLYDMDSVFGRETRQRPVSAVIQQERDSMRARPKSAAFTTQRNERPLKYETTRPVSAKSHIASRGHSGQDQRLDKESSKTTDDTGKDRNLNSDSQRSDDVSRSDKKHASIVTVDPITKKADSVEAFVEDMKNMNVMEDEFRKSTFQLQRKLGIRPGGLIY